MNKLIILSEQKSFIKKSPSAPQVDGQEKAFLKYGGENVEIRYKNLILKNITRILNKINLPSVCDGFTKRKEENAVFVFIAVNLVYLESNAYLLKELKKHGNKISAYCYDVWEPEFADWQKAFDDIGLDYIFFGFKQSYEHYKELGYNAFWVPLSGDFEIFKPTDKKKSRLFIQMGRRNDVLHEKILNYLKEHGLEDNRDNYVYRHDRNERIYPDIHELAEEIGKTKYFVCVPKFYENLRRTGNINSTICRFYEGMACKTMLVGMKSYSFDELFPYKAMISFNDGEDFDTEIEYYESHPEEYEAIVNKNYEYIMEHHSWGNRVKQILEIINQ